jgi:hypothetical protein
VRITHAGAKTEAGKVRLTLTVEQQAPAYTLRLPLEIVIAGRAEMRSIDVAGPRDVVTMLVDAMPEGVRLDPDLRVWRVLDRTQLPPILRQWVIARAPRWVQASGAGDVREAATALAKRFFEAPPQPTAQDALHQGTEPVMLIGLHEDVDRALAHAGLPPRPASLAGRGSAQVWTLARDAGAPVAVVSARDADALRALLAPLPHYGAQSWLVFDGRRAVERGVWPAPGPLIAVQSER